MNYYTTKCRLMLPALLLLGLNTVQAQEFQWAKVFQSDQNVDITGIDYNNDGEFYVTGWYTFSMDIDPGPEVQLLTASGQADPYYAKFDADGNLIWGFGPDANGIATGSLKLDNNSNMFITGGIVGTQDVDPGPEVFNLTSISSQDAYLAKFSADGSFIHAINIGGSGGIATIANGLAIDSDNNIIMVGITGYTIDLDPGPDEDIWSVGADGAPFVTKFDNDLNYLWGFTINSDETMAAARITTDAENNILITYILQETADFDPGSGEAIHTSLGAYDLVVAKYSPDGEYIWSQRIGGINLESMSSMTVDDQGNVYCTGDFGGTVDFDPGPGTATHSQTGSNTDGFIIKYSSDGTFQWVSPILGDGYGQFFDIAVDNNQNIHVCGSYGENVDFDPGDNTMILTTPEYDYANICYAVYSALDGSLLSVMGVGSTEFDTAHKLRLDPGGAALFTGRVEGIADLDPGPDVAEFIIPEDAFNSFLIKMSPVPVSVLELAKEEGALIIFPNPSNGLFNIRVEDAESLEYNIFSIDGRLLESGVFTSGNNNIELNHQATGTYMLRTNSRSYLLYKH